MPRELSEEEIMNDDKDPLEAISEIRREEGMSEDELEELDTGLKDDSPMNDIDTGEDDGLSEDEAEEEDTPQKEAPVDETPEETGTDNAENDSDEDDSDDAAAKSDNQEKEAGTEEDTEVEIRKFRANGQDFEFTDAEMLEQFGTVFGQAMNYTKKMQNIAPYRKMISAIEQEGITHDSLNLAIDALKGDKGAIKKLLEQNKLDAYDLTSDEEDSGTYNPKDYGKNETQLEIEEITSTIKGDEEFAITTSVIDEQWDDNSRRAIAENPNMIVGLHNDIKNGVYDKVAPRAMKMKVLDGNTKSDIEYYMIAGQQLAQEMETEAKSKDGQSKVDELNAEAQNADSKFDKASSEAERKRSAASTGTRADRKGVIDYLDDDDEAYEEWYKKLHASV